MHYNEPIVRPYTDAESVMVDGKPIWGKNCTKCCACIGRCPVNTIEYGNVTVGKTKYYYGK